MKYYYYPRTLEGITTALMDMFNDIKVVRYDADGNNVGEKDVPLTYGPMEKYHLDRIEDNYTDADGVQHGDKYYLQIPRMALYLNGIAYNSQRAAGANTWRYWFEESLELSSGTLDTVLADYQPTPYDYNFTLFIKCDSMGNLAQILENILPYFNPKLNLRVKEFSFLNIERNLPVSMDGVNPDFSDDQTESDSRYVNASINFTVEGWQYRPILQSSGIIKIINTKYLIINESAESAISATGTSAESFLEGFSTSAYETSGGVLITSATLPSSADYITSGHYVEDNKEYDWYKGLNN